MSKDIIISDIPADGSLSSKLSAALCNLDPAIRQEFESSANKGTPAAIFDAISYAQYFHPELSSYEIRVLSAKAFGEIVGRQLANQCLHAHPLSQEMTCIEAGDRFRELMRNFLMATNAFQEARR